MAIFGTAEIVKKQTQNPRLLKALDYITKADFLSVFKNVTYANKQTIKIDGDNIFAIFQAYKTKYPDQIKMEGHKKYIDIQYIFSGEELILLATENDIVSRANYNSEKDVHFPEVKSFSGIHLRAGDAAVFFPEDLHGPCYCVNEPVEVLKVVFKIAVD